jgi:hypothetical protein
MLYDLLRLSSLQALLALLLAALVLACAGPIQTQFERSKVVGKKPEPYDIRHVRPQDIAVKALPDLAVSESTGFSVEDCMLVLTIRNQGRGGVPADEFERAVLFIYIMPWGVPGEYTRYAFSFPEADPENRLLSAGSVVTFYTGLAVNGTFVADLNLDPHDDIVETDETNGDVTRIMEAPASCDS